MLYFEDRNRVDNCGNELTPAGTSSIDCGRDELDGPAYAEYRWVFGGCAGAKVLVTGGAGFIGRILWMRRSNWSTK